MKRLSNQTAPCGAKLVIIFEAMLAPGHFSSGVQSSRREAVVSAGSKLSEEPENDEHGNSERLGAE